jgi:hypothetical protein
MSEVAVDVIAISMWGTNPPRWRMWRTRRSTRQKNAAELKNLKSYVRVAGLYLSVPE